MRPAGGRVNTSFDIPQLSGGRGKWDCGNNSPGNGSSSKKYSGTGLPDKFPGNKFPVNGSSGSQPPGKRPPCHELFSNKAPGNKFPGTGSSGNRAPRNELPGSIQDGKREALQLCKGHIGSNEQRGAVLNGSKFEAGRVKQTFVFGGNLSTVPSPSEKWTPAVQAQPAHIKEIPDLAKALQTAVKETVSDSRLHAITNFNVGLDATRLKSEAMSRRGGEGHQEERIKQLEQRVGDLEQQLAEEKAAKETLLANVERVLAGKAMEETTSEVKLVRLVHDIMTKIPREEQDEQVVPLDQNGNETPAEGDAAAKYCKNGSPGIGRILQAEVGTEARSGEASIMVKQYPGIAINYLNLICIAIIIFTSAGFLPRALVLGTGNKGHKGDLRNTRHQKQGEPVLRGALPTVVSKEEKMKEKMMVGLNKQSSLRSPDGRMLA